MLDTNIIDKLLLDKVFIETLNSLVIGGKLRIFITEVLKNQLRQTPNVKRREELLLTLAELRVEYVPVEFAPYGYAYGECYGGLSPDVTLDHQQFIGGNTKQVEDAMIAATVTSKKYEFDYIVTDDDGFRKRVTRQSISTKPVTFDGFKKEIAQLQ